MLLYLHLKLDFYNIKMKSEFHANFLKFQFYITFHDFK